MTNWLSRDTVYVGPIFAVKSGRAIAPDGGRVTYDVVESHGGVGVVPVLPDGSLLLVSQHRVAAGVELLEIPAGKLESEDDDPKARAALELEEETGYRAAELDLLADFFASPAYCTERIRVYVGRDLAYVGQRPDDGEAIRTLRLDLDRVRAMLQDRQFRDAKTIIGLREYLALVDGAADSGRENTERP